MGQADSTGEFDCGVRFGLTIGALRKKLGRIGSAVTRMTTEPVLVVLDGADGNQQAGDATPPPAAPLNTESPALKAIRLAASSGRGFGSETTNVMAVGIAAILDGDVERLRSELNVSRIQNVELAQKVSDLRVELATAEANKSAGYASNAAAKFCLFITAILTPIAVETFQRGSQRVGVVLGIIAALLVIGAMMPSRLLARIGRSAQ